MKDFLKITLATAVGIVITSVVMLFLGILFFFNAVSSSSSETVIHDHSVLMLDLNGVLMERNPEVPFQQFMGSQIQSYGLNDILNSIQKAKENDNIEGIYLQPAMFSTNYASLEEIRQALADFKESGKWIISYADVYSQGTYYMSSVADKVLLNPEGNIEWRGLAAQPTFFKRLLEKVGGEMQVFKVGTYKSAVEPFISTEMSPANREQLEAYLHSTWQTITQDVAQSRGLSVEKLNELADGGLIIAPAQTYVESGMADTLIYKNDVRSYLKRQMGLDEEDDLEVVGLAEMINVASNKPKDKSGNIIAVYYAEGEIVNESLTTFSTEPVIDGKQVIADLRDLTEDDDVKAVVLRVNSHGGSAYASEQIWKAVSDLKAKKPVIVSMGDYAASGGYYISCNADTIVAQPATLTGSIGIFGMFPNMSGLIDKVGIDLDVVKTNTYSNFGNGTGRLNEGERAIMQQMVNRGYDLFLTRCSDGRGISKEELDKIAQGRVWTGATALELGLVDVLGGLDTALAIAVEKAGVEGYTLMSYPAPKGFFELLTESNPGNYIRSCILGEKFSKFYQQLQALENIEQCDRLQARLPFEPNIQ